MHHILSFSLINLLAGIFAPTTLTHHLWTTLFTSLALLGGLVTHVVTHSYKDASGTTISKVYTVTGNSEANFDAAAPIAANTHYVFNLTRSQLQTLFITSDVAIDIYTNAASGGSPTDHIVLLAGQVIAWSLVPDTLTAGLGLIKCPITADITAGIYVTNGGAAAANLKIRAVLST